MRRKQVPPDKTRDSRRLLGGRRFARNDSSPAFRVARNDNSRGFRRAGGWGGLVGHAEGPARRRAGDRPLHAERIRCWWGGKKCAGMGPVGGVGVVRGGGGVGGGGDTEVVGRRPEGRRYDGDRAGRGSRGCR